MTTFDLIGQMINPQPMHRESSAGRIPAAPAEPLAVLLGRIMAPPVGRQPRP